ncbi:TMEM165/GDT1 family protein [Candidatus Micrarchaeota archaeon]|nr:TMEM165/GDT1 family protein [Candidatus Micrarchaeota archaeon]
MISELFTAFAVNFLAELGDKTQLAVLALSAKNRQRWRVLSGAVAALGFATLLAVLVGNAISGFVGQNTLKTIASLAFIGFGAYTWLSKGEKEEKIKTGKSALISSFVLIFLMELGDKTQLANLVLASTSDAYGVFVGAFAALALLTAGAVFLGKKLGEKFDRTVVRKASVIVFVLVGLAMLFL